MDWIRSSRSKITDCALSAATDLNMAKVDWAAVGVLPPEPSKPRRLIASFSHGQNRNFARSFLNGARESAFIPPRLTKSVSLPSLVAMEQSTFASNQIYLCVL